MKKLLVLVAVAAAAVPSLAAAAPAAVVPAALAADPPSFVATPVRSFPAFDANQAVAVDAKYFYAVNNRTITKHDRRTGEPLLQFAGDTDGPFEHLDSAAVVGSKLYAVHSNYPEYPMESSIEVFDTRTMRHVGTHSFGSTAGR